MAVDDLIVTLRKDPTPEEHAVAEGLGLHDGAGIPFRMFARVAAWAHRHGMWIRDKDDLEKKIKRRVNAALGLLAASILTVLGGIAHRLIEEGRDEERQVQAERAAIERRDALEREIQDLRLDVRELRAAMRRISGSDLPASDSTEPMQTIDPDKFAGMLRLDPSGTLASAAAMLLVPPPSTCGASCSSNIECNSGLIKTCPFCNFGTCKSTRPESPVVDAGIDAP